jgi:Txe/YoeB family toxin of Txe-Axe toxin-antitoxin module
MNIQASVVFISHGLKADFQALKAGKSEEQTLYEKISVVMESMKSEPFSGTKIQKSRWPKFYKKRHKITNLWKYDLPDGWRLIYTIEKSEERLLCIIIEWFSHPEYNRRFGYHDS